MTTPMQRGAADGADLLVDSFAVEATPAERIRAQAREATRKALLQAGLQETVEQGGEFPSIAKLCLRAGYTRGAFYLYFEDRDQFLNEMLEWVLDDIIQSLFENTTKDGADIHQIVRRFDRTTARGDWPDLQRDIRAGYLAVLRELRPGSSLREHHANLMLGISERLEERFRQAQAAGTVRNDVDAHDMTTLLVLIAIGSICWNGLGIVRDDDVLGESLLRILEPPA